MKNFLLLKIIHKLEKLTMAVTTVSEAVTELNAIVAQNQKVQAEVVAKLAELNSTIQTLQDAMANQTLPAEVTTAFDAVKVSLQSLDDVIPDAPVPVE